MTRGVYVLAGLTALLALALACVQLSLPAPKPVDFAHPEEHPYYQALRSAERVWSSQADDQLLANEQARLLLATCSDLQARQRLFQAVTLMFPEGAFLEDGVHMGMLNRLLGALTQLDEMQTLNPRVERIRNSYGFGTLHFVIVQTDEKTGLEVESFTSALERPIGAREISVLGMTAENKEFSFLAHFPNIHGVPGSPIELVSEEDLLFRESRAFAGPEIEEPLRLKLQIQFRLVREDGSSISQPSEVSENFELARVSRPDSVRFLPAALTSEPSMEEAVRAIARGMHAHQSRVRLLGRDQVLVQEH